MRRLEKRPARNQEMNSSHFPEIHLHQRLLKIDWGKYNQCAADSAAEDIWGSTKARGGRREEKWVDKEMGVLETDQGRMGQTTHMELWEDTDTTETPCASYRTKEMPWKASPSYCHPSFPAQNPKMAH